MCLGGPWLAPQIVTEHWGRQEKTHVFTYSHDQRRL